MGLESLLWKWKCFAPPPPFINVFTIVLLMKIFMNLQCMKSINLFLKTDKRHCMPHLYIHATLYSMHRLVVQVPFIDDVSSLKNFESSETVYINCIGKKKHTLANKTTPKINGT